MPYARIWVHAVFSTKNRMPLLLKNIRNKIWYHILNNCRSKKIYLQNINGLTDHAHCLFQLGRTQTLSAVMNMIKGESSNWINKNKLTSEPFQWQAEYWAASISDGDIERVKRYIDNQEEHHKDKDFEIELQELIKEFGFEKMD